MNELITPTLDETKDQYDFLCFIWWTSTDLQDLGKLGGVANSELAAAIRGPEEAGVGKVCSVQIPHVTNPVIVFVKEDPDKVQWPKVICCQTDYRAQKHHNWNQASINCIELHSRRHVYGH